MNRSYYDITNPLLPPPSAPTRHSHDAAAATFYQDAPPSLRLPAMSGAMPPYAQSQYRPQHPRPGRPMTSSPRENRNSMSLQVPVSQRRPRSVPPLAIGERHERRRRSLSPSSSSSSLSSSSSASRRHKSPIGKVRHAVKNTFTDSPSGLGVGTLGAVVGGLVAHEVSQAAARRKSKSLRDEDYRSSSAKERGRDQQSSQTLATIAGAIIGGLGANAVEKRFEGARERDRERQEAWEKRWGRDVKDDDYVYDVRRRRSIEDRYRDYR